MSGTTAGAFAALTVAAVSLWSERSRKPPQLIHAWMMAASLSLVLAVAGGLIDHRGLLAVVMLAVLAAASNRAHPPAWRVGANVATLGLAAGMFLHVVPGFANPRVLSDVLLSPDAVPYTKYLNFDKGMAGLILLGLYVPDRVKEDQGWRHARTLPPKVVALAVIVMMVAWVTGYLRWAPKLPAWWPLWMWSMVLLTALPEEAAFRGVIQSAIAKRRGRDTDPVAIALAGVAFGLVHVAGGPIYVLVATLAGVGYGWIYAQTRSIGSAIATHAGLNALHLLLFTYPALAMATSS
jgi:membrane protease YdiL (CAAX protease family)